MAVTDVYDATHANIAHLPAGLAAGYTTGSGGVPWTAADWAAHPGAVRICQDAMATDETADLLDVERGAATLADCAPWVKAADAAYKAGKRPGQRRPAIYCSRSMVTAVANALTAGGVSSCPLVIADYSGGRLGAANEVDAASGPFPVIGRQYADMGRYDASVFSVDWLHAVSVLPPPPGPYRHTAPYQGQRTLAGIAHLRGTTVAHLVQVTAGAMTAAELAALGALELPDGTVFYTSSP